MPSWRFHSAPIRYMCSLATCKRTSSLRCPWQCGHKPLACYTCAQRSLLSHSITGSGRTSCTPCKQASNATSWCKEKLWVDRRYTATRSASGGRSSQHEPSAWAAPARSSSCQSQYLVASQHSLWYLTSARQSKGGLNSFQWPCASTCKLCWFLTRSLRGQPWLHTLSSLLSLPQRSMTAFW